MARREQHACARRQWEIAQNFPINDFSGSKIDASVAELEEGSKIVNRRQHRERGLFPTQGWSIQRFNDLTLSSDLIGDIRGSKTTKVLTRPALTS
jgi:hypothetical protein